MKRAWGLLFLLALGCGAAAEDRAGAFESLLAAAEAGDVLAQFRLAERYRTGGEGAVDEGAVDEVEGFYWNGRAAQQGHADAQFNLGLHYRTGRLFPADLVRAYMWLSLAEARDQPLAKPVRQSIMRSMSADEIAEAEGLVRAWEQTLGSEASCAQVPGPSA